MGFLLFFAFSLLLARVSPLKEAPKSFCREEFKEDNLNGSAIHLTLHHPRSPCSPAPLRRRIPFSDVLLHDDSRVSALISRLTATTKPPSSRAAAAAAGATAVTVPISAGASLGAGNYVTKISLGTPPISYAMVVDTGSNLNWLQCAPCRIYCHEQSGPVFNPAASATYRTVPCSAAECGGLQSATLNPSACTRSNVCVYEASYGDTSFSVGYLSQDALSLAGAAILPSFVFGCGQDNEGLFGQSAGLIGLAKNKLSLLSQLSPKLPSSFSYCLPTAFSAFAGRLSFGAYNPAAFTFTPMVADSADDSLYFVKLTSITVGSKPIPVAASEYSSAPTFIDSGAVITRLPSAIYSALSKAVSAAMAKYPPAAAFSRLDTCFKGSVKGVVAPEVALVFQGGATLKLAAKNLLIDVQSGTTCLAFIPAGGVTVIGNWQQQTFTVVYDVANGKIGFAAGGCA